MTDSNDARIEALQEELGDLCTNRTKKKLIDATITVGELIDALKQYPKDAAIIATHHSDSGDFFIDDALSMAEGGTVLLWKVGYPRIARGGILWERDA